MASACASVTCHPRCTLRLASNQPSSLASRNSLTCRPSKRLIFGPALKQYYGGRTQRKPPPYPIYTILADATASTSLEDKPVTSKQSVAVLECDCHVAGLLPAGRRHHEGSNGPNGSVNGSARQRSAKRGPCNVCGTGKPLKAVAVPTDKPQGSRSNTNGGLWGLANSLGGLLTPDADINVLSSPSLLFPASGGVVGGADDALYFTEDDEDEEEERLYDAVSLSSSISSSGDDVSSEGGFSRVSSTGSLSGLDDRVRVKVHPGRVDIFNGAEHLRLRADGLMELRRVKDGVPVLVTAGRVSLPDTCRDYIESCEITVLDESIGAVQLKWINGSALRVVAANPAGVEKGDLSALPFDRDHGNPASDPSWAKKLACGFVCEFSVAQHAEEEARGMAEVELDMRTAGYWFGGGHYMRQHWPLNRGQFEMGPFFPFDNGPNGTNTLLAPQWMTSRGLLVLANPDTPFLHVGLNAPHVGPHDGWIQRSWGTGVQNLARESLPAVENGTGDGMLRLQARASYRTVEMLHPLRDWMPAMWKEEQDKDQRLSLQFALCATANVKQAAEAALETLPRPANPPPREMVDAPIWTTWARYHANVTQAKVEQFAHEIVGRGLSRSVMEIDDKWQTKYGDFDFDPVKFPNPKAMVEMLHALGFKVTLWIMPFVEEASAAYQEGAPKGYFISSSAPATKGLKPGFFKWWQPVPAAALDVTNPEAVAWFVGRLKRLQADYLIDGFKFDAGEPCFLPPHFVTHKPIVTPVEYTRLYVQEVASQFSYAEVRTGHKTSSVPLLTRMGDRFSTWSTGNGLRSVIPTLLTSGILGYPFCLPDMVGGNAYFGNKPDVELLVRWAQANALMPAMQFSIAPWDLSKEADRLCKAVLELREKVAGTIFSLMEDACSKALAPVCRPMWWLDPDDAETFPIDDQFAIGDDIVVAPVVVKGQKKRDVYLPKGTWCELLNPSNTFEGPTWLEDVEAPLHIIPIYCRVVPTDIASPNQEGGQEVADHASAMVPVPVRIEDAALVIADSEALAEGSATQTTLPRALVARMDAVNPETALAVALAAATCFGNAARYLWEVPSWLDCPAVNPLPYDCIYEWTAADEAELRAAPAELSVSEELLLLAKLTTVSSADFITEWTAQDEADLRAPVRNRRATLSVSDELLLLVGHAVNSDDFITEWTVEDDRYLRSASVRTSVGWSVAEWVAEHGSVNPAEFVTEWTDADEAYLNDHSIRTPADRSEGERMLLLAARKPMTSTEVALKLGRFAEASKNRREHRGGARLGFSPLRPALVTAVASAVGMVAAAASAVADTLGAAVAAAVPVAVAAAADAVADAIAGAVAAASAAVPVGASSKKEACKPSARSAVKPSRSVAKAAVRPVVKAAAPSVRPVAKAAVSDVVKPAACKSSARAPASPAGRPAVKAAAKLATPQAVKPPVKAAACGAAVRGTGKGEASKVGAAAKSVGCKGKISAVTVEKSARHAAAGGAAAATSRLRKRSISAVRGEGKKGLQAAAGSNSELRGQTTTAAS
ncbi:unnamed protein product [Closterium sp. NIES-64]|nr:unnamed protein product [Closterium sp. NIES-64]